MVLALAPALGLRVGVSFSVSVRGRGCASVGWSGRGLVLR